MGSKAFRLVSITEDAYQYSYYQVTGLTAGEAYLVGLSDAAGVIVGAFANAAFTTPVMCTNFQTMQGCDLVSPGTSLYLRVGSYSVHSRRLVLNVHGRPLNQGEYQAPLELSYPDDFPYSGEAAFGSEYLITSVPMGPHLVSLAEVDAAVSFEAWAADGDTIDCESGPGFPRCTLEASAAGGIRLRVNGPGHFELSVNPAPVLISDFTRDTGVAPIPNADVGGLSDELVVDGSPVTSITALRVELFVRHGIPAELEIFLVAPDGTEVLVAGKDGGPYEGRYFDDYELESFDGWWRDAAFTVRPTQPLHAFEGLDANGTWTIRVVDDENPNIQGNVGELYGWGMTFR